MLGRFKIITIYIRVGTRQSPRGHTQQGGRLTRLCPPPHKKKKTLKCALVCDTFYEAHKSARVIVAVCPKFDVISDCDVSSSAGGRKINLIN